MTGDVSLVEEIRVLPWFHSIDFGGGIMSPGQLSLEYLNGMADLCLPRWLAGKTVLDIGCWDGFYSFEAHRRMARRVLATDHFAWTWPLCWGKREAFELARRHVAPKVEVKDIDLADLSLATVGTFDFVLLLGVFYHLRHPFWVLENVVAPLVKETLVLETYLDAADVERPAMIFYPGTEVGNDPTNWWGPNPACVTAMLKDVGFSQITHRTNPAHPERGIFHATR
jgi:tRNA (mo5U34)-methyltransferase